VQVELSPHDLTRGRIVGIGGADDRFSSSALG
jgi:hypothetical protein